MKIIAWDGKILSESNLPGEKWSEPCPVFHPVKVSAF